MTTPTKAKKLARKRTTERPAKATSVVEEKKPSRALVTFGKVYEKFLNEQRVRLEELKNQFADDPTGVQYLEDSFNAVFHDDEYVASLFSYWLDHKIFPDAERGWKILDGRLSQSKAYSGKRQAEWKAYAPWLDEYFKRNPSHSPSDGRRACAKQFKVVPKTIERRTRGYQKPVNN